MAELPTGNTTYSDLLKELDPDGKPARMIQILNQSNRILEDLVAVEANQTTGHRVTVDSSLPEPTVRFYNKGVAETTGTSAQFTESIVIFEARSAIDRDLAHLGGNVAAVRMNRARKHVEGFNQKMAKTLVYGSNADSFPGFHARYNALTGANNSDNVISGGGTGSDNTSILLVGFSDYTVHSIYPKGSKAGMFHEDLGVQDAFDSENRRYRAYMDLWQWQIGLCVADWRYVVRICNIDVSNLVSETAAADLVKLMIKAYDRIPFNAAINLVFYCNRTVASMLKIQALNRTNNVLAIEPALTQFGKSIYELKFMGVPVKIVDQITNTEGAVS